MLCGMGSTPGVAVTMADLFTANTVTGMRVAKTQTMKKEHERGEEAREVELSCTRRLEEEREEGDEGGDPEETARDGQDDA